MSLDQAPDHVKLAVDLIELLEENNIAPDIAVEALTLVLRDFQNKLEK
ncbi:pleiotropic regulatory protein RsmS [Marinomonas algarum]|uniref:Pleiotropic regulatory protein RsmS n=1 Tax=Marinomonas algarum TaxID=2883105 RepID=A0A9X1IKD8_9GAMM|nr:pleiotropic regulatory protein RsmS [Marinomonas algarum]MCB5160863.1 pleiotropic regulatory protein RsmS [Marinomonas algarum]